MKCRRYKKAIIAFNQARNFYESLSFEYRQVVRVPYQLICYQTGLALYYLGCYEEALSEWQQLIRYYPSFAWGDKGAELHYYRGKTLEALGRAKEAQQAYEESQRLSDRG